MKLLTIGMLLMFASPTVQAQSIVGSWKTISIIMEDVDGKTKDITAMQRKRFPCMADILTVFQAGGKQVTKSPANCAGFDYNKMPASDWKLSGNELTITNSAMPGPLGITAHYTLHFSGNRVLLTHVYTEEEKKKLPASKNLKQLQMTYESVNGG